MDVKIRKSKLLRYRIIALLYIVFVSLVFLAQDSGFVLSSKSISDYLKLVAEERHQVMENYERIERHRFLFDPELENLGLESFRDNVDSTVEVIEEYQSQFLDLAETSDETKLDLRELKRKSYSTVFFHVEGYLDSIKLLLGAYRERLLQLSESYEFDPEPYLMSLDSLQVRDRIYNSNDVFFRSKTPVNQVLMTYSYLENKLRAKEGLFIRSQFQELEEKRFKDSLNADEIQLNPELLLFNPERRNKFFRGESILVQYNVDSIYGINLNLYHYERGQRFLVRNVQFQEYSGEGQFEMILDDIGAYDLEFTVLLDNSEVYEGVKQIQVFDDQRENLLVEGFTCFILHPGYDLGVYEYYKNEGLYFSPELLKRFREVKRKYLFSPISRRV